MSVADAAAWAIEMHKDQVRKATGIPYVSHLFAVAALAVTVSMLVGITLLVGSFRATLDTWIQRSLVADIFVTGASSGIGLNALGRKATVVSGLFNKFYAWENRLLPRSTPLALFGFLIKQASNRESQTQSRTCPATERC